VAKVRHEKPITRRLVKRGRRRIWIRVYKETVTYASKWPNPRGPAKSPAQRAWIEHFIKWSYYSKQPDPCAVADAKTLAPETGYWPRDIIHSAGNGKYIDHDPQGDMDAPLPYLFRHPPNLKYEGVPRVITPTTSVRKSGPQHGTFGAFEQITPDVAAWDNNAFWSPTDHPERLTFRSKGVFLVNLCVSGYSGGNGELFVQIRDKDGVQIAGAHDTFNANFSGWAILTLLLPVYAGDWIDARIAANPTGNHYTVQYWQIMAITPEGVL